MVVHKIKRCLLRSQTLLWLCIICLVMFAMLHNSLKYSVHYVTSGQLKISNIRNLIDIDINESNNKTDLVFINVISNDQKQSSLIRPIPSESDVIPQSETKDEFFNRMTKRMIERKAHLRKYCSLLHLNPFNKTLGVLDWRIPFPKPWLYFSKKYKIIFGEIPKSGCGNWKKVMMVLNEMTDSTQGITDVQAHTAKIDMVNRYYRLPSPELLDIMKNSTKLIVVRDPLERLVSAYRSKIMRDEITNSSVFAKFSFEVARKYGSRWKDPTKEIGRDFRQISACGFEVAELRCEKADEVIQIVQATFGRFDNISCGADAKWRGQICSYPHAYFVTSQLCDGKKQCEVVASSQQFENLNECFGLKYNLNIVYRCKSIKDLNLITVCPLATQKLQCPPGGVISIASAFYGRRNRRTCAYRASTINLDCDAPTATSAVFSACHSRPSCVVVADPLWIQSDPCQSTTKYLQVWYSCTNNMSLPPYKILDENKENFRYYSGQSDLEKTIKVIIPTIYDNGRVFKSYPLSATFEEFVAYLVDPANADVTKDVIDHGYVNIKSTNVRHWKFYHTLTYPCHIDYDIIGHLETIEEDARYLLDLIGAPRSLQYPKGYNTKSGKSTTGNEILLKSLQSVNRTLLSKLFAMYSIDYKLFGYDIPYFG